MTPAVMLLWQHTDVCRKFSAQLVSDRFTKLMLGFARRTGVICFSVNFNGTFFPEFVGRTGICMQKLMLLSL